MTAPHDGIHRRTFLKTLGAASLGAVIGPLAPNRTRADGPGHVGEQCYRAFRRALKERPWLGAFQSVDEDALAPLAMTLDGQVPKGLVGTFYRNGPTGLERNGVRYQHWFDGDGMVQAFRIGPNGVIHHARKVQTAKYAEEGAAGRFLYGGAGSSVPTAKASRDNDTTNPANISVVPYDGRLLALWEAGSAHALDPKTLATEEAVVWTPKTARMPFSAHPVVDNDGGLWNFGLTQWGRTGVLFLYRVEPKKGLTRVAQVPLPYRGYAHSFSATPTKLVLYLSPNVFDPERRKNYVHSHRWQPELGGRILIVDKNDFSQYEWIEAPAGFVFHMVGAADEPDGGVRFHACWSQDATLMNDAMGDVMWGRGDLPAPRLTTIRVTKRRTVKLDKHDPAGEFPVVDPRGTARNGRVYLAYEAGDVPWVNALGSCDPHTGRLDGYSFGADTIVEEPLFVPRPNAKADAGWLMGTFFDARTARRGVAVFDAQRIKAGPIFTASMKRLFPLGFHGWFWPGMG